MKKEVKIGIIVGKGTGKILSEIFKCFLECYAPFFDVKVSFEENKKPFDTFWSLKENDTAESVKGKSKEDAEEMWELLLDFKKQNIQTIFRTGINAESLYLLRQKAKAVKEITFKTFNNEREVLVIRDEMQGFYANTDYHINEYESEISGHFHFKKENFEQIFHYANQRGKEVFKEENYEKWAIYKYHILSNVVDKWVNKINKNISSPIRVYQPDTGLSKMYDFLNKTGDTKKLLLIVSNEVGDLIYESLLETLHYEDKNELYTKNIYLHPNLNRPLLYQTVHGSADDLMHGRLHELNPYATLRIIAEVITYNFQDASSNKDFISFNECMEYAINNAKQKSFFSGKQNQKKDMAKTLSVVIEELNNYLFGFFNKESNQNKKEIRELISHIKSLY